MKSVARRLAVPAQALCLVIASGACRSKPAAETETSLETADTSDKSLLRLVGEVLPPADPGVVDILFQVVANRDVKAISPLIYGFNDSPKPAEQRWGVVRLGGNRWTAYNWENNASNAGSDYFYQNDALISQSDAPAQPVLDAIDAASAISAANIITISNADYVSADKLGNGDVRQSGPDYLKTRFKRNFPKKPGPLAAQPNKDDNAVYQDEYVAFLKAQRPRAKLLFSMDNEPDLWSHTHAEIIPEPITYAGLWKRNHDFASAVKDAWPGAPVLGFVSYGYTGMVSLQNAKDGDGRNFVEWYLDQARAAEKKQGRRIIDYLDVHWYPEAMGGNQRIVGDNITPEVVTAREQAPRSLWDAKYEEKSWIRDQHGGPIDLIHWLQAKVNRHYPGTKLAFTEWNYGGPNHISGAIAVADVLGTFGKHGVGLACYWPLVQSEPFPLAAFRAYRNFDGQLSAFGDTSIAATSSDIKTATVYASIDSKDPARTVIIAINKANNKKKAGIRITHSAVYATAQVFVLSGAQPTLTVGPLLSAVATNAFRYEMPPQSVSVIVPRN